MPRAWRRCGRRPRAVRLGEHDVAVAVGSELVSRALRQSRYLVAGPRVRFDAEFLRWTLSDGAGAVVLEPAPRPDGLSLRLDWMHLTSHAHEHPVCMFAGLADGGRPSARAQTTVDAGGTWLDQPDASTADRPGMLVLRQDVRRCRRCSAWGCASSSDWSGRGRFAPADIDHVLCHYSAEHFRGEIFALLRDAGLMIAGRPLVHQPSHRGQYRRGEHLRDAGTRRWRRAGSPPASGSCSSCRSPAASRSPSRTHLCRRPARQPAALRRRGRRVRIRDARASPLGTPRPATTATSPRWAVLRTGPAVWDDFDGPPGPGADWSARIESGTRHDRGLPTAAACTCASRSSRAAGGSPGPRRTSRWSCSSCAVRRSTTRPRSTATSACWNGTTARSAVRWTRSRVGEEHRVGGVVGYCSIRRASLTRSTCSARCSSSRAWARPR